MRCALSLAYRGDAVAGGWVQGIAPEVDAALARLGEPGGCRGASRTDAGVHAHGQVAVADLRRAWDPAELAARLDAQLPPGVACRAAAAVDDGWDLLDVRDKTYAYAVDAGPSRDPFIEPVAWRPPSPLDAGALGDAARLLAGRRDFTAFLRSNDPRTSAVRTMHALSWHRRGRLLVCRLRADGFVMHLARSLVGAMACHARGGCTLAAVAAAADGQPSEAARQMAPAHGLHLLRIRHRVRPSWLMPARA